MGKEEPQHPKPGDFPPEVIREAVDQLDREGREVIDSNPFVEEHGEFPRAYVEHRRASGLPLIERSNAEIYDLLNEVNERLKRLEDSG